MTISTHGGHSWEPQRTRAIMDHILAKAEQTPSLTAVRYAGKSASYRQLAEAIDSYGQVADHHALNSSAALPAAILHCLPGVSSLGGPAAVANAVGEILTWLGRDLPDAGEGRPRLRAVG